MSMKLLRRKKKSPGVQQTPKRGFRRRLTAPPAGDQNIIPEHEESMSLPARTSLSEWSMASTLTNLDDLDMDSTVHSTLVSVSPEESEGGLKRDDIEGMGYSELEVYESTPSFPDSLGMWLTSADALLRSQEMSDFVLSSRNVAFSAGTLVVRTAFLPVTLPLHVAYSTTELVVGSCMHVVGSAGTLIERTIAPDSGEPTTQEHHQNPLEGLIHGVFSVPSLVIGIAGRIKDDIGSVVIHVVSPVLGIENHEGTSPKKYETCSGEPSSEQDHFLDRLRLDYTPEKESVAERPAKLHKAKVLFKKQISKYLLRVDDIGLSTKDAQAILYIDLSPEHSNDALTSRALQRIVHCGFSLIANHPTVRMTKHYKTDALNEIEWKTEGSTGKLLRKMAKMSTLERLRALENDTLVWSGKYKFEGKGHGRKFPFFLARGVVKKRPRDFLKLLWDNSRTAEYNNFCLGRSSLLTIDDKVLSGASEGTKVVRSETRVPFTGLSVMVSCLMHVRPLEGPDEGFVILSRSVDSGVAGTHVHSSSIERSEKNEILWGINIIRRVPNNPHLTDLTSLSQVGSSLVPKFLAGKIAMMGVHEFFDNVRRESPKKA